MKLKTNSSSLKLKMLILFFALMFVVSSVARCIQIATVIDASTGFYTKSAFVTGFVNSTMLFACAVFAVVAFLSKESSKIKTTGITSKPLFALSLIFSITLFVDCASSFFKSIAGVSSAQGASAFKALMISGTLPLFFESVFALLSGFYFIFVSSSFKSGKDTASKHKLLALMPIGWVAFRMVGLFVRKISFTKVSDLFFELIMLGFMILFFMAFAQLTSNVYSEGFSWRIFGLGLPAGFIAAVLNVSRLIFSFVDSSKYINGNHPFNICDLIFAAFIFIMCLTLLKKQNQIEETSESADGCE